MGTRQRALLLGTVSYLAVGLLAPRLAVAEVATDGTMGRRVSLRGGNIEIGADLGQQRGGNLFHSFRKFDVETKGRVAFTGPDSVKNVIGRVTGGEVSSIDGTLASTIPDADLYLINPAGILFGPNARLDVKGSFHASTADELRLADGAVFSALDAVGSTLSVAPPQAFGFLGGMPGRLMVDNSILEVSPTRSLSLVGGEIDIVGGPEGRIIVPSGRLLLAAIDDAGSADLVTGAVDASRAADISLRDRALIGTYGGALSITAENLTVDGSYIASFVGSASPLNDPITIQAAGISLQNGAGIYTQTAGVRDGAAIIAFADTLTVGSGSYMRSAAHAAATGRAGPIRITAADVAVRDGGQIASFTVGKGDSGGVTITAGQLYLTGRGSSVTSGALTYSTGNAGNIQVAVTNGRLLIEDGAMLQSSSEILSFGNVGTVEVHAPEIVVRSGGRISSSTNGGGDAGGVVITAQQLSVEGRGSGINSQANRFSINEANAGTVRIESEVVNVSAGGQISSSTFSGGDAGGVDVTLIGSDSRLIVNGEGLLASIASNADRFSSGNAGRVSIMAPEGGLIELRNGGQIGSSTFGTGDAGNIEVEIISGELKIDSDGSFFATGIVSQAEAETRSSGKAGSIIVEAGRLTVVDGGSISSASNSDLGNPGTVWVEATNIVVDGEGSRFRTAIASENSGESDRGEGSVSVFAMNRLELRDGGEISASTFGEGDAGNITLGANNLVIDDMSNTGMFTGVASRANRAGDYAPKGDAGSIAIETVTLAMLHGGEISTSTDTSGDAGAIAITTDGLLLSGLDSAISSRATEGALGQAGSIDVAATTIAITASRAITTSTSGPGGGGDLAVRASSVAVLEGGRIESTTSGRGQAGRVEIEVSEQMTVDSSVIATSSSGAGAAGDLILRGPLVRIANGGSVESSGNGTGAAGDVRIRAGRLAVQDASVRTEGQSAEGGRIAVTASDRIYLRRAEVTSNGIQADPGASIITLEAPKIVLNASTVTSLTDGQPLAGSGEARLIGDLTVISADSLVAGSTSVVISGLQTNLGSDLQLPTNIFLDASGLLQASCAERGAARSTFSRGGRGGLPPSPDRPLPSAGLGSGAHPPQVGAAATAETVILDACAGTLVRETHS